jgi:hypothetical protein
MSPSELGAHAEVDEAGGPRRGGKVGRVDAVDGGDRPVFEAERAEERGAQERLLRARVGIGDRARRAVALMRFRVNSMWLMIGGAAVVLMRARF